MVRRQILDVFVQLGAILSVIIFIYKERFARFLQKKAGRLIKADVWHVAVGIVPVMGVAFCI